MKTLLHLAGTLVIGLVLLTPVFAQYQQSAAFNYANAHCGALRCTYSWDPKYYDSTYVC
jgi:hypothetical protein